MKGLKSLFHLNQEIRTDFTKMQKLFNIQCDGPIFQTRKRPFSE